MFIFKTGQVIKNFNKAACLVACSMLVPIGQAAEIEEVVVTAQKRTQSINDVGLTISAYTGEQLQEFGVSTAEDIALFTPGLTINETSATGVPLYSIRGVGFQDYSTGASSTVGLYFDEVNIPYTVMSRGAVFDIDRLEVLKGPQGDLYGRNTTAGQINFISNEPTDALEASIGIDYGTYEEVDVEGFVSGPISNSIQGRLAFKAIRSGEGWQKSLTRPGDTLGEKNITAFRAMLNFDLSDSARLLLRAHYVGDTSENRATTAYNGLDAGLGSVSNAHLPLQDFTTDRVDPVTTLTSIPPWFSTGDSEAADWTNSYTSTITGTTFDLRPQRDNELQGISAKLEWDISSGVSLSSNTSYDAFSREEANDWDGGAFNDSSNINTSDIEVFSQELRLSGVANRVTWVAGAYYSKDTVDEFYHYFFSDSRFSLAAAATAFNLDLFNLNPILELDTRYEQETESGAVFAHIELALSDAWNLTLGARYTSEERTWTGCTFSSSDNSLGEFLNANFGASVAVGDCGTLNDDPNSPNNILTLLGSGGDPNQALQEFSDTLSTDRLMGKVGVDYSISNNALLYFNLSQGFKSGGFNGANTNTTQQIGPYKEEVLTAYEIGFKSTLLDKRMQLNLAAFYYDYKDKQEQDLAVAFVGNISGLTNIPESRIYGAELDLQWRPIDRLDLFLQVAYLDTEIEEWLATSNDSTFGNRITVDAAGTQLPQSPEWSVNMLANIHWFNNGTYYLDTGIDLNFKDETVGVGDQVENATSDYTVLNGRITFGDSKGSWTAQVWMRNITDKYYYPSAFRGGNGPYVRVNGLPRTVGIALKYNFF